MWIREIFHLFQYLDFFLLDQFFSGSGYDLFLRNADLHRIFFLKLMDLRPYIVFFKQALKLETTFPQKINKIAVHKLQISKLSEFHNGLMM